MRMSNASVPSPLAVGIGLRSPHVRHVIDTRPDVPWFEVHSENHFVDGGPALQSLLQVRDAYPIALHGVGMSLGSVDPLDAVHLAKLARLIERVEPWIVSEHLCFGGVDGRRVNDLLPLPYTDESLAHVCRRIDEAQGVLGRRLAIENVSSYVTFPESHIAEGAFLAAVVQRTGCALLLDINNLYVNAVNHRLDTDAYLAALPADAIVEYHLAGFERGNGCLIDTHGAPLAPEVWSLYRRAVEVFGPRPSLIEWDTEIPPFAVLQREAHTARQILGACDAVAC
jgi:uncharacterized protein